MADNSAIEWTDATWNPIRARNLKTGKVGWHCEHATTGCEFCYSEGFNKRLGTGLSFKPGHRKDIEIFLDEKMLLQPLRWKKSRMIFVCSMTDLFADFVSDEWIDQMFAVMALCPQHTFQVLTKRAARMREYCHGKNRFASIHHAAREVQRHGIWRNQDQWPLPNVWLGVSAERQEEANERIPELLATPAAVRFISAEPLLGPIDLTSLVFPDGEYIFDATSGQSGWRDGETWEPSGCGPKLDWVIVGGESGPGARPMHPNWARALQRQCDAAGVKFFFKQWGAWLPGEANRGQFDPRPMHAYRRCDNHSYEWPANGEVQNFGSHPDRFSGDFHARKVGKKLAGRLLDKVEYNDMPELR